MSTTLEARDVSVVFEENVKALRRAQPELELGGWPEGAVGCVGRDGAATYLVEGKWWRGCSVPRAAARAMLESLAPTSVVACFLAPMHPAALVEALSILGRERVLIAIVEEELELFLGCEDLAGAIAEGRLKFARSAEGVGTLLRGLPGLPLPELLVRTGHAAEETNTRLIEGVRKELQRESEQRGREVTALLGAKAERNWPARRVVVARNARFRAWDDAGDVLAESLEGVEMTPWCADRPAETTLLHVLELAARADALVAADLFRGDWEGAFPADFPVVTWVTKGRVGSGGARDRLIVTDAALAEAAARAGWKKGQVAVAGRPGRAGAASAGKRLAIIADLGVPKMTEAIVDFSSRRLACERIEAELKGNPFRAGEDLAGYVEGVRASMEIAAEGFPAAHVIEHWALPIWQAGVAGRIAGAGVEIDAWGSGWEGIAGVRARGEVRTREAFHTAIEEAGAVLAPAPGVKLCDGYGKVVVQAVRSAGDVVRQMAAAGTGKVVARDDALARALAAALGR